jgi:DNA-binding response OmpR family regulator
LKPPVVAGGAAAAELARKLEQRGGYAVRLLTGLTEIPCAIGPGPATSGPAGRSGSRHGQSGHVATARQPAVVAGSGNVPLFFLADRGDITARLEAVETGGAGYFLKPVDIPMLLEALDERVLKTLDHRILIVDDSLPSAREIARRLDSRGMKTRVLAQPLLILQALRNFQPSLLILSLDLKETDGVLLALAIQQHELFRELPLVLLIGANRYWSTAGGHVGMGGEALLGKPLNPELLFAAIANGCAKATACTASSASLATGIP